MNTIRLMLSFAVQKELLVHHIDVNAAYLNADLDEEIYIEPPQGSNIDKKYVCKL
jgi:hypothetical protein